MKDCKDATAVLRLLLDTARLAYALLFTAVAPELCYLARMPEDFLSARAFSKMHSCA